MGVGSESLRLSAPSLPAAVATQLAANLGMSDVWPKFDTPMADAKLGELLCRHLPDDLAPCRRWLPPWETPPDSSDRTPGEVDVGVKFRSDAQAFLTGAPKGSMEPSTAVHSFAE
jgi:hypothetical protein